MLELIIPQEKQLVKYYRLSRFAYLHGYEIMAEAIYRRISVIFHSRIYYKADIGPGFRVHNARQIGIIGKIGKNLHVSHGVTIGCNWRRELMGRKFAGIGDNLWVMTGVVIVGSVTICDNTIIVLNCVIHGRCPGASEGGGLLKIGNVQNC